MKKNIKIFASFLSLSILFLPALISFAKPTDFKSLINEVFIGGLIRPVVPLLIGLAVVLFIYGVIIFMFSDGGEKKEDGKSYMIWGIVGIFVMVSVWGLVAVLQSTFQLSNDPSSIKIIKP